MEIVKVCPELDIVMEVNSGLVAEMRKDILVVDLIHVEERVQKLEKLVTALENSLDPRYSPLVSYPNRDGVYAISGYFKGIFFGFWITLAIMTLAIFTIIKLFPGLIQ
ncbi:tetrahydromethanopterin S-methyltransferase, subunit B [Methanocaldococcus bathoardescens]|uniref:Tetrahydromethanopterin S-methyltransferase subunit B n=1 Tax=Methanocaldococcus bathoardescens TaxID=1301915 RepID=A0A076LHF1_9EURY|nr:tetrahydromethanopterin S-methyltransferase subunit B [Methanocaldococcus bathoardescens]AIJ05893.1 tetrahydromethanopterin S-methyltransferase, subunit B [Methanocaldococcus bathoardescens]